MFDFDFIFNALKSQCDCKMIRTGTPTLDSVTKISIDSRTIENDQCFLAIKGDNFDL